MKKYTAKIMASEERVEATIEADTRKELEAALRGHGCGQIRRENDKEYTVFRGEGLEARTAIVKIHKGEK
jgi:hypothetical protein